MVMIGDIIKLANTLQSHRKQRPAVRVLESDATKKAFFPVRKI